MIVCNVCLVEKPLREYIKNDGVIKQRLKTCRKCCDEKLKAAHQTVFNKSRKEMKIRNKRTYYSKTWGRAASLYTSARLRSKKLDRPFEITSNFIKEKIEKGICEKSGLKFDLSYVETRRNPFAPSVDRIDSNGGYTVENTQIVCSMYNAGKNEHDELDFIAMCLAVAENNRNNIAAHERLKELRNARL